MTNPNELPNIHEELDDQMSQSSGDRIVTECLTFDPNAKDCGLCGNTGMVEIIPEGGGGNDSRVDECPWCLRRKNPSTLTAENGAKAALSGEYFESIELPNPDYCGCGDCDYCIECGDDEETYQQLVPVSWSTIKKVYADAKKHFATL